MLNQLARYVPVARLVDDSGGRTLLDVGSGSRGVERFVSARWAITAADLDFSDYGTVEGDGPTRADRVVADARALPFENGAFDVVVAVDLIEHVPPRDRRAALSELARVAARRVCVACPTGGAALAADERLARYYRRLGQPLPGWLAEHLEHGFPEPDELRRALERRGSVRLLRNEWVRAHELVGRIEITPAVSSAAFALARVLERAASGHGRLGAGASAILRALRGWDRPPAYRTIAVLEVAQS